ncbi:hypothetical protein K3495_g7332 [Podosphaera aphanis]|nr:hypothetical protein K3495_g7332 [Podosphaera aphanis]
MNLIERLQHLQSKGFHVSNDQQLAKLNEWSKLVVRGRRLKHSTCLGYEIIRELLKSIRPLNESVYQMLRYKMLKNDRKKVPADVKMWVDNLKDKLMPTHSDSPSSSYVSRASFATLKGSSNGTLKRQHEDSSEVQGKRRKKNQDCP